MMILNNAVITTAGTFTGPTYQLREPAGHGPPMFLEFQETFTFGSGAAVTADVYIQTSFDGGLTWCDAIHYAQLATASARFIAAVGQAGLAPVAPTSVLQEGRGNANIDAGLVHLENLGSGGFRSQTSEFEAFHRERRIMPKERFGRGRTGVGGRYCIINSGAVFVMTNRQAEKCQTLITRT